MEPRDQGLGSSPSSAATTAEDGSFGFLALPAGSYRLRIEAEGFAAAEAEVEVAGGPPARVEVHLRE